jgi:hypothetical protein
MMLLYQQIHLEGENEYENALFESFKLVIFVYGTITQAAALFSG